MPFNMVYPLYQRPNYNALSAYSVFSGGDSGGRVDWSVYLPLAAAGDLHPGLESAPAPARNQDIQGYWLMGALASMAGMLGHGLVDTVWYRPQISTLWWLCMALVASFYMGMQGWTRKSLKFSLAQQFESITT